MAEVRVRAGEAVFQDKQAGFFSQFLKGAAGGVTETLETVNKAGLENRAKKAGQNSIDQYIKYREAGYSEEEATARVNKQRGGFLNRILAGGRQEDFIPPTDDKVAKAQRKAALETKKTKAGILKTEAETQRALAQAQGGGFTAPQRRKQGINKDNAIRVARFGKIFDPVTETYSDIRGPKAMENYLSKVFKDTDINDPDIQFEIGKKFGEFKDDDPSFRKQVQLHIFQLLNQGSTSKEIRDSFLEDFPDDDPSVYWFKERS